MLCRPFVRKDDAVRLRKAFEIVLEYHRPTWEETGREYIYHSIEVAKIVIRELNLGVTSVVCALLHNVVDGRKVTLVQVREVFGKDVATIVEGYTRLSDLQTEKISVHSENFRKLYLSIIKDIRVILIKLAHRVQDLRNFSQISPERRERFLEEVYFLYIPIAHRLGLYHIKHELEERWMLHSQPEVYEEISLKMRESRVKQNAYIQDFINPMQRELIRQGFDVDVKGRPKSIYSVWRKMKKQNVEFEEVYDLFAIRLIINSEGKNEKPDCWRAYSIVTDIYPPNPKRLRDWISTPKASGYESLHTTVMGPNGKWVEVQIRTKRMDEIAEKGLAAHWKYKESAAGKDQEEWMSRIREVIEHPDTDTEDIRNISRVELYSDRIYVFTPEGDLKKLPSGSTVLDFAYDIHSSLGDMCSGAKVNGRIVPIRYVLNSGDKVEIITSKNQKPKLDWLNFVVTPKATAKIKRAFREEKMRAAETGKEILRRKLRNRKIPFSDTVVDKLIKFYRLKSSIDLYYLIAEEKIDLADIRRIIEPAPSENGGAGIKESGKEAARENRPLKPQAEDLRLLEQKVDFLNYKLAKCCNPVHGDEVFGFVAIGKGITIHRNDCPNAESLKSRFRYRIIKVDWREIEKVNYYVTPILVEGKDEVGMLNEITSVISTHFAVDIVSVKVNTKSKNKFEGVFKVRIKDIQHLKGLIDKIRKINGVRKAERSDSYQKI